ncbi:Rhodopsin domain-containing protein [Madurella fahalii]|uniref:Rhodopsin domain-containing protein n=1 Tax=Madurella fahalii TaxID=1157608 RepID=A0ABQ0GTQ0_9PEZI
MSPSVFEEPYPGWAQENKGPLILTTISILTAVALLFVAARIYSRKISLGRLGVDDYIVIICIILSLLYVALAGVAISYGGGRHVATLPPEDTSKAIYYTIISFVPGVSSFTIPKFAVVILLAKILDPNRWHKMIMWIVSTLYLLLAIGMLVINFAQCTPAAAQWGGAPGYCWDRRITVDYAMALGVCSALFDFYLATYPTVVLCKLQLNWKKKLALSSSLGFGYCAAAITCYKCYTLSGLLNLVDFTYAVDDVVLWTNIEGNCVLIGACIPTLFPLVKKLFGASALGDGTPKESGPTNTVVTIGSYPKNKKRAKNASQLDTIDGDTKYIILEERPFHHSAADLRAEEAATVRQECSSQQPGW